MTLLERYNIPARPFEEELLRELDGRGEDERLLFLRWISWISASEVMRERLEGGFVWVALGDVTFDEHRDSPM